MHPTERPEAADSERVPEKLAEAGVYKTPGEGFEHGLVVLAMGSPYWLVPSSSRFPLLVEPDSVDQAREQLARYDLESEHWPPRPREDPRSRHGADLATPLVWACLATAAYACQTRWYERLEEAGALDSRVLSRWEVWRLLTALFLHVDIGHLMSNLISGIFIFSAVTTTMGRLRGWLQLTVASAAGNLAAVVLWSSQPYRSMGASTAIFAGLGLLTGRAIRIFFNSGAKHRLREAFVPLAAGMIVLALYGAGGMQVDMVAHLAGFSSGLILGFLSHETRSSPPDRNREPQHF